MPIQIPSPWIVIHRPKPQARLRLFCFPFAGGAASIFRTWGDELPADIEVCAVQLPGRESRRQEPLLRSVQQIVDALAKTIGPQLDRPFAFFGHSMGASVAFELARRLERQGDSGPVHVFVSAREAPHFPAKKGRHTMSDELLTRELRQMGGTPEVVLRDAELMEMFLPIVRADLEVTDTYRYEPGPPLRCPLTALRGTADREIYEAEVEGWREYTSGAFTLHSIAAGHFFVGTHRAQVLGWVSETLGMRSL